MTRIGPKPAQSVASRSVQLRRQALNIGAPTAGAAVIGLEGPLTHGG